MSLTQMMKLSGIDHSLKFNSLLSNWVLELERAEAAGVTVRPVRLGSKRVVLSTQEARFKSRSVWYLVAPAVALTAILVFALNSPKSESPKNTAISCKQISVGEQVLTESNSNFVRDWRISLTQESVMGNLLFYRYSATCSSKTDLGDMILVKTGSSYQIKKLTPTKR